MTNLDSILKCRDITLPTKVRLVKAIVFPVFMYGCESWNIKKAECQKIDVFEQDSLVPLHFLPLDIICISEVIHISPHSFHSSL